MNLEDRFPVNYKGFVYRKSNKAFILNSSNFSQAKRIMLEDNLFHLEINPNYFNSDDLSFLKEFDFITELSILSKNITDIGQIECLKNIKTLYIENIVKGKIDFNKFKSLRQCIFTWGIKGGESIFNQVNLEKLSIYKYNGFDLLKFISLINLNELELINSKIESLLGIEYLSSLKEIDFTGATKLISLKGIDSLDNLEILKINRCKLVNDLSILESLNNLKKLHANDGLLINDLSFVEKLINLEEIFFIGSTKIINGNLSPLEKVIKKNKLKWAVFVDRKNYSHINEQLGYQDWVNSKLDKS
ncbi:hypothetical protein [Flavobacterium sp. N2270]|jgi:Leucine-rich repeat (LRR) protein|uniref:hypothetical protein n=1 Tax=Flavobacterium sp. N2270 TaxID=2986831 RepID=UPI002224607C|nr:hypothetical protein [Flavobacterium sp. N2270]